MVAIKPADADTFVARPNPAQPIVLIYGGDAGLVRERAEKIARIKALGCTHFIDDLEEVFIDSDFPSDVERFLLSEDIPRVPEGIHVFRSWHDIATAFFD